MRTSIRPTVAEVDLGALRRNVERVRRRLAPGVALYAVVKADAYGHGAIAVARAIEPLCDALAVSLVEEGLELRAEGIAKPILVLGAYYGRTHSDVLEHSLTPVIYEAGELDRFASAPRRRRRSAGNDAPADFHLKINTGMNRLGITQPQLSAVLDKVARLSQPPHGPHLRLRGICTHFASADLVDPEITREQLRLFDQCLEQVRASGVIPAVVHAANSAATLRFPEAHYGAVRPGLALYGGMPSTHVMWEGLERVMSLRTRIMAIHDIEPGGTVSYGGTWRASRASRIATLPLGYADGFPQHVRDAEVLVQGRRARVVGTVCMDMMMVDVTDVPGAALGDAVTLMGQDGVAGITLSDLASWAGTSGYEILCGISKRVPRIYRDGPETHD